MTILTVPALEDGEPWPTLGPQVAAYIETNLVFGPGDLRGRRAKLDPEKRALLYRMYEVYPEGSKDANGKLIEGRRRFRRCCWSTQKGSAKTELAAWIAACELAPDAPVRCDGFSGHRPIGRPVTDPYIPMVAYTEEQSEDLAYAALKAILEESEVRHLFDIGIERILRAGGDGKAVALAGAPDARDGARTTFGHKDETHRWVLPRLVRAHRTMLANLPKRLMADPWELETTTAYSPGENSVAEQTAEYAAAVADGRVQDSRLFYFHRQASDGYDVTKPEQLRAALLEAAGPTAAWKDIDGIADQWQDPKADREYLERVYLNRPVAQSSQAFDSGAFKACARPGQVIPDGALVTLGFDGSRFRDATGIVATEVETGFQQLLGGWENTQGEAHWEVNAAEVDATVNELFERFDVWRMYCDPRLWESYIAKWAGRWGDDRVVEFATNSIRRIHPALRAYDVAIRQGELTHDGNPRYVNHVANARRQYTNLHDEEGNRIWIIQKERPDSPMKIDYAMAGCLSWEARNDAVAAGATSSNGPSVYEERGIISF